MLLICKGKFQFYCKYWMVYVIMQYWIIQDRAVWFVDATDCACLYAVRFYYKFKYFTKHFLNWNWNWSGPFDLILVIYLPLTTFDIRDVNWWNRRTVQLSKRTSDWVSFSLDSNICLTCYWLHKYNCKIIYKLWSKSKWIINYTRFSLVDFC